MEEKDYYAIRKAELDNQAQIMKDRFIDELLLKFSQFSNDWNTLVSKKQQLDKDQAKQDKLQ